FGEMHGWNHLGPDRLPDPGGAVVPDGVRLIQPVLLPPRLADVVGVVLGADDDDLVAGVGQRLGDVEGEGGVPTFVPADVHAVHPDVGDVIHGAEVQQ